MSNPLLSDLVTSWLAEQGVATEYVALDELGVYGLLDSDCVVARPIGWSKLAYLVVWNRRGTVMMRTHYGEFRKCPLPADPSFFPTLIEMLKGGDGHEPSHA